VSLIARGIVERREVIGAAAGWKRYIEGILTQLRSSAGISVTPEAAMRLAVFFDCVRIIAEDTAKLPLFLYRRLSPRGKELARDHYLFDLVHRSPNSRQTSFEFRETVTAHMAGWGNGYVYKETDRLGKVLGLWPLRPDRMTAQRGIRPDGDVIRWYDYTLPNGLPRRLSEDQVVHLRGLSFDGELGYDLHVQARDSLGLAIGAERHAGTFFANDATPRTVLTHPKALKEDARKNVRESWEERFRGVDRHHLIAILEEGMDIKTIGIDPEKAQMLATREFSIEDICRWFRMPPHKVAHLKRSTFSNIEHQALEYVGDTLITWCVRWEQRLGVDLLREAEQEAFFFEHQVAGLLRGDFQARMNGYKVGREIGLYNVNDVLELENRNPIGPEGDVRHVPANWTLLTDSPPPQPIQDVNRRTAELLEAIDGAPRARARFAPLLQNALETLTIREIRTVSEAAAKRLRPDAGAERAAEFRSWIAEFYGTEFPAIVADRIAPVLRAYGRTLAELAGAPEEDVDRYLAEAAERIADHYRGAGEALILYLEVLVPIADREEQVAEVRSWLEERPQYVERCGEAELEAGLARFQRRRSADA